MFHKNMKKGFVLAYALFLLVIFSVLGVAIVSMLNTSSITSSEDLLSLQALFLAESGAEIRIREALESVNPIEGNRTYKYNNFNNFITNVSFKKIVSTPDGKQLFSLYSTGKIFNVQRKIFIKFWK